MFMPQPNAGNVTAVDRDATLPPNLAMRHGIRALSWAMPHGRQPGYVHHRGQCGMAGNRDTCTIAGNAAWSATGMHALVGSVPERLHVWVQRPVTHDPGKKQTPSPPMFMPQPNAGNVTAVDRDATLPPNRGQCGMGYVHHRGQCGMAGNRDTCTIAGNAAWSATGIHALVGSVPKRLHVSVQRSVTHDPGKKQTPSPPMFMPNRTRAT